VLAILLLVSFGVGGENISDAQFKRHIQFFGSLERKRQLGMRLWKRKIMTNEG
jgi:hypothetical protein